MNNDLPSLQKEILLLLANKGPLTRNEIAETLGKSYKNVLYSVDRLLKKDLIQKVKLPKEYRKQKFDRFWLSDRGFLCAYLYKVEPELLKRRINYWYSEEKAKEFQAWCDIAKLAPPEFIESFIKTICFRKDKVKINDIMNWVEMFMNMPFSVLRQIIEKYSEYPSVQKKIEETREILLQKANELNSKKHNDNEREA